MLITISNFMGKEPVTGLNAINGFLKFFSRLGVKPLDPTHKYLSSYSKIFLVRELNLLFKRLRLED